MNRIANYQISLQGFGMYKIELFDIADIHVLISWKKKKKIILCAPIWHMVENNSLI